MRKLNPHPDVEKSKELKISNYVSKSRVSKSCNTKLTPRSATNLSDFIFLTLLRNSLIQTLVYTQRKKFRTASFFCFFDVPYD